MGRSVAVTFQGHRGHPRLPSIFEVANKMVCTESISVEIFMIDEVDPENIGTVGTVAKGKNDILTSEGHKPRVTRSETANEISYAKSNYLRRDRRDQPSK